MVRATLRVQDDVRVQTGVALLKENGAPRPRLALRTVDDAAPVTSLEDRLEQARGNLSFRELATLTDCNQESIRRYHRFGQPSFEYVLRLCEELHISPNWLLFGKGECEMDHPANRLLVEASAPELLHALATVFQGNE